MSAEIEVRLDGARGGTILVDGHDVSHAVQAIEVEGSANARPVVRLTLAVRAVTVTGEAPVEIDERAREALLALGWVAP